MICFPAHQGLDCYASYSISTTSNIWWEKKQRNRESKNYLVSRATERQMKTNEVLKVSVLFCTLEVALGLVDIRYRVWDSWRNCRTRELWKAAVNIQLWWWRNVEQLNQIFPQNCSDQDVGQLVCGAHMSNRNRTLQIDPLQEPIQVGTARWVRDTCLKLDLRPFMIIRLTASLSLKM